MAVRGNRVFVKMKSAESGHYYYTIKHKSTSRLELKKYDPYIRKHVNYKEEK